VVRGNDAMTLLDERRETFVMEGKGVRCVSDRPWVTAAETCECLMAYLSIGEIDQARTLFEWAQSLRSDDGHYWTGIVFPQLIHFPGEEKSTYTAASVLLAADALTRTSPASALFVDHDFLPDLIDLHTTDLHTTADVENSLD